MPGATDIAAALATLRAGAPGCALVAYADIGCGMVYTVDVETRPPQEALDALAARAAALLGPPDGPACAIDLDEEAARLFLRAPEDPGEALCLICTPEADLARLIADGTALLDRLGARL